MARRSDAGLAIAGLRGGDSPLIAAGMGMTEPELAEECILWFCT